MKAVVITTPGGPEVLQLQEVPDPTPQSHEVVIEVAATALNRADLLQRRGNYDPPVGSPPYPGLEVAGRIAEVGEKVTRFKSGDRVMALLGGGGYAERVAVAEGTVMPIPDHLSWRDAAAIPEGWLTAYSNMMVIGKLQHGERVLIHAGGSGVGTAAIQLAKWRGATVFTTASAGKLQSLQALGADYTIDYKATNFADTVLDITNKEGVNLIIEFIGAPYWEDDLRAIAKWGRIVYVGTMGGNQVQLNLGLLMHKKLSLHGSTLRDRTPEQKAALVDAFTHAILPVFNKEGSLRPVIDERPFTLEEIQDAHRYMESNSNLGKIVVTVQPNL